MTCVCVCAQGHWSRAGPVVYLHQDRLKQLPRDTVSNDNHQRTHVVSETTMQLVLLYRGFMLHGDCKAQRAHRCSHGYSMLVVLILYVCEHQCVHVRT